MTNDQRLIVASVPGDKLIKRILKIKYCITVKIYSADKTPAHTPVDDEHLTMLKFPRTINRRCDRSHEQIQLFINETTVKQHKSVKRRHVI